MTEQSIEAKSRAIAAKRNEPGEEFKDYQSAANQLLEIQAAQKENLNMARLEGAADASQNELLAQSAALMAANNTSQAGGNAQLNPATQTILNKYGLNAPKVVKQTERVVTPQKINITNNNITNNNVSVPANIGGPLQGRPLQFSQPQDNTGNFKNWISNVFARQEANAVKRQAEYDKKDRSLTRSANRIMRKLEDMTKTIGSSLDPRKIGSTWQSQLKTLGFLFGLHRLTKNWEEILNGVQKIGNWFEDTLDYFGIVRKNKNEEGQSRFVKNAVKFLGGQEGETIGQALIKLFGKDGIAGLIMAKMTQLFGDFSDRVKLFFEERGAAIKQVKFPDLKPGSRVIEVIKGLGIYLADILACLTGGTEAAKQSVVNNIYNTGALDSEKGEGWKTNYNKFSGNTHGWVKDENGKTLRNTSWGEASIAGTKTQKGQNTIDSFDIVDNGRGLFNNTSSSIKQSRAITSMAGDLESGKVHTGAIMTGMERLKSSINKNGYTLVDPDFVKTLGENLGIEELKNLDLGKAAKEYKFIQVEKTDEDYAREGANIGKAALEGGIEGYALEKGKELSGAGWGVTAVATGEIIQDPSKKALWEGTKAGVKKLFAEDNKLVLVPADDPRPGVKIDGKEIFNYLELDAKSIKSIEEAIGKALKVTDEKGNSTFTFDVTDKASREAFNTSLTNTIKAGMDKRYVEMQANASAFDEDAQMALANYAARKKQVRVDNTDLSENTEALQHLSDVEQSQAAAQEKYNQKREDRREEYESAIEGNRAIQVGENIETAATNAYNSVKAKVGTLYNRFSGGKVFDVNKAIASMNKEHTIYTSDGGSVTGIATKQKSQGVCAGFVRNYLQDGGIDTSNHPGSAKDYGPFLEKRGWTKISVDPDNPSSLEPGDVCVEAAAGDHAHGHIQMWSGNLWVSDFAQRDSTHVHRDIEGTKAVYRFGDAINKNSVDNVDMAATDNMAMEELGEITTETNIDSSSKDSYIKTAIPYFEQKLKENGITENTKEYAYWMTAQTGLESDWGTSPAAVEKNNLGGIMKARGGIRSYDSVDAFTNSYISTLKGYGVFSKQPEVFVDTLQGGNPKGRRYCVDVPGEKPYTAKVKEIKQEIDKAVSPIYYASSTIEPEIEEEPMYYGGTLNEEVIVTAEKPKLINPVDIAIANTGKSTAVPNVNTENITSGEINPLSPLNKENVTSVSDLLASIKNGIDYGNKINELGVSATGQVVDSNAQIVQAIVATNGKQGGKQVYASREYSSSPNTDNIV